MVYSAQAISTLVDWDIIASIFRFRASTLLSHRKRINEDNEDEKPDERREQAPLPSHRTRGPERVGCGQLPRTEADGKTRDLPVIRGD